MILWMILLLVLGSALQSMAAMLLTTAGERIEMENREIRLEIEKKQRSHP